MVLWHYNILSSTVRGVGLHKFRIAVRSFIWVLNLFRSYN